MIVFFITTINRKIQTVLFLSVFFFLLSNYCSAKSKSDSLIALSKNLKEDTALVRLFIDISKAFQKEGDSASAVKWGDESIRLSKKINFRKGEATGNFQKGSIYQKMSECVVAKKFFNQSLDISLAIGEKNEIARSYLALAGCELNLNHYDSTKAYAELAIKYAIEAKDSAIIVKAMNSKAGANYRLGRYQEAITIWLQQMKIAEAIKDSVSVANTLGNIGTTHSELKNLQEALKFQKLSLERKLHNKQTKEVVTSYINTGRCYLAMSHFDSAYYFLKKGIPLSIELNMQGSTALLYNNLSSVFLNREQYDSALHYTMLALEVNKLINDSLGLANSYYFLGDAYSFTGKKYEDTRYYSKAEEAFKEGHKLSRALSYKEGIAQGYMNFSDLYAEWKKYEKAHAYMDSFVLINDTIRNEKFNRQIAELQAVYETEKKENEIIRLNAEREINISRLERRKTLIYSLAVIVLLIIILAGFIYRNIQRKRNSEKMIAMLEKKNAVESMRSKIAGDVHDDMGSNLTRIGLYSQQLLGEKNMGEAQRETVEKILVQSKEVVTGMKEIIWASDPAHDNLRSLLSFMRQYINRFLDGTKIHSRIDFPEIDEDLIIHPELRRNLFLILKEALNNSVKYSGTEIIDILFSKNADNYKLMIKDYGKGFDSSSGKEFSNGLNNMQLRSLQIHADFDLETTPGSGVIVSVRGSLY